MMPFSESKQMWQLSVPMPLDRAKSLQNAGPAALHLESLRLCGDWHAPLPTLIGSTLPENVTGYPVCATVNSVWFCVLEDQIVPLAKTYSSS